MKIDELKAELTTADDAEGRQLEAAAAVKDATKSANDNLFLEIKKLRNSNNPKPKPNPFQP